MSTNLNSIKTQVWTEKYRPRTLEELMIPSDIRQVFSGELQNFLFVGPQGTGKTSAAKILSKGLNVKKLNMSLDKGIDTIRHTITTFAVGASMDGKYKVVILDEIDALRMDIQQSLRGVIEDFAASTIFIATCNYPERLIPALKSRFKIIDFSFSSKEASAEQLQQYVLKIASIMQENDMTYESKDVILHLINNNFPDFRAIVNQLAFLNKLGKKTITVKDVAQSIGAEYTELYSTIASTKDPRILFMHCTKYKMQEVGAIQALNTGFTKWLLENKPDKNGSLGEVAVIAHKYNVELQHSADALTTLFAAAYSLSKVL